MTVEETNQAYAGHIVVGFSDNFVVTLRNPVTGEETDISVEPSINEEPEWQHLGDNDWVFGFKVRGVVRKRFAEVYYDEDKGWVWMAYDAGGSMCNRGVADKMCWAIEAAEKALGVQDA